MRDHYDKLVDLHEEMWGEHIHHGYPGEPGWQRQRAQQRAVEELINFAAIPVGVRVLDSGCSIGASAITLAENLSWGGEPSARALARRVGAPVLPDRGGPIVLARWRKPRGGQCHGA